MGGPVARDLVELRATCRTAAEGKESNAHWLAEIDESIPLGVSAEPIPFAHLLWPIAAWAWASLETRIDAACLTLVTAANLKKIGVNAELQPMDWSTMTQRRASKNEPAKGGWNIIISGWEGANITPLTYAAINTSCEKAWFGWPCNAEIERLRVAWSRETDATKRKAILDQLHALLVEEAPIAPVGQRLVPMAWRNA